MKAGTVARVAVVGRVGGMEKGDWGAVVMVGVKEREVAAEWADRAEV